MITLITGASSGLGAALAPVFAADGDTVILTARREDRISALAQKIQASGGKAHAYPLDVTDREAVQRTFAQVAEDHGPIDLLIANAGVGDATPATRFDAGTLAWIFRVNILGVSYCLESVLPGMLERKSGQIVGISSLAGSRGIPGSAAYCASKSALTTLLESLRIELAPLGVTVTTICPGFVKSELTDRNRFKMPFLVETDVAARKMHAAIRAGKSEYAFPWQLALGVKAGKFLPNFIYDRALRGKQAVKDPVAEP